VPQGVRADGLGDAGPADDPPGAVAVQAPSVGSQEHWSLAPLADSQVNRPCGARGERDGDDLAALTGDHQGPVAALDAHGLDAGAGGF
jgi:hypothetical protein